MHAHSLKIDLEQLDLTAVRAPRTGRSEAPAHHGARDGRQAARERSFPDRAGRAAAKGSGRSYAFRRS